MTGNETDVTIYSLNGTATSPRNRCNCLEAVGTPRDVHLRNRKVVSSIIKRNEMFRKKRRGGTGARTGNSKDLFLEMNTQFLFSKVAPWTCTGARRKGWLCHRMREKKTGFNESF